MAKGKCMDCFIRKAEQEDQEALVVCVQAAYSKYIERIGKKPAPMLVDYQALIVQQVVYVLTDEKEIRGMLVMMPQNKEMFVENIAIDPRFQGRGLGRMLMAFVEQQARKEQLEGIRLYTNEVMTENLLFYHRLGFEEEGRYVQDGYRRVFLWKRLR
jgi:ribosomal protein S18 acetylase RimI-like enzyme